MASELQAVFRNKKYPNLKAASEMKDGVGIMSWFGVVSITSKLYTDVIRQLL